jgi:uncharacterized protein (TIGR02996 family)
MTATLHCDIPRLLGRAIEAADAPLWESLAPALLPEADRGTLLRRQRYRFTLTLPGDRGLAWRLCAALSSAEAKLETAGPAAVALPRLLEALGLPPAWPRPARRRAERGFLEGLQADPADLVTWSAYADWLQEQADAEPARRGLVMAGWLSPGGAGA